MSSSTCFRPNAPLWGSSSAPLCAVDRCLAAGSAYDWPVASSHDASPSIRCRIPVHFTTKEVFTRRWLVPVLTFAAGLFFCGAEASAFCGFYVGKADSTPFNKVSEVAIARHDNKTVITMATITGRREGVRPGRAGADHSGERQIHVGDPAL